MKRNQCNEIRNTLMKYRVVENRTSTDLNYKLLPDSANIIFFGPSGSGKSSLIKLYLINEIIIDDNYRTFHNALHNTLELNDDMKKNIIVQKLTRNEGTTKFTKCQLKEGKKYVIKADQKELIIETSNVNLLDTRGQIMMDDKEVKQIDFIIEVQMIV